MPFTIFVLSSVNDFDLIIAFKFKAITREASFAASRAASVPAILDTLAASSIPLLTFPVARIASVLWFPRLYPVTISLILKALRLAACLATSSTPSLATVLAADFKPNLAPSLPIVAPKEPAPTPAEKYVITASAANSMANPENVPRANPALPINSATVLRVKISSSVPGFANT